MLCCLAPMQIQYAFTLLRARLLSRRKISCLLSWNLNSKSWKVETWLPNAKSPKVEKSIQWMQFQAVRSSQVPDKSNAIQCPLSARSVPAQCPLSAHCKNTAFFRVSSLKRRNAFHFLFLMDVFPKCCVFTVGTERALSGHWAGTERALSGHCKRIWRM